MLTNNTKRIYSISADLLPIDTAIIKVYIQGAVYSFCNNNPKENFSVRILFGGDNRDWNGTPLQRIFDWYIKDGKNHQDAADRAAIDLGILLKTVLTEDARQYEITGKDSGTLYRLKA